MNYDFNLQNYLKNKNQQASSKKNPTQNYTKNVQQFKIRVSVQSNCHSNDYYGNYEPDHSSNGATGIFAKKDNIFPLFTFITNGSVEINFGETNVTRVKTFVRKFLILLSASYPLKHTFFMHQTVFPFA